MSDGGKLTCQICGAEYPSSTLACPHCVSAKEETLGEIRKTSKRRWNPELAAFLSLLVPGAGQFYLRQPGLGLVFLLPSLALCWLIVPWIIGMKISAIVAFITAYRRNGEQSYV